MAYMQIFAGRGAAVELDLLCLRLRQVPDHSPTWSHYRRALAAFPRTGHLLCINIHLCMHLCVNEFIYICVNVLICMILYAYIYICIGECISLSWHGFIYM
jgi:hypothetical protein